MPTHEWVEGIGSVPAAKQPEAESMPPFQRRVVKELEDLDEKRAKLSAFLDGEVFESLSAAEQKDLSEQLVHMSAYSTVLGRRIARFA